MEAEASIRRDFFRFVRADSSAIVKRKFGVADDSVFEITRGEGQPLPEKNVSIVCKEQFQSALEAAVEQVRAEAMLVMQPVNSGLDTWTTLGSHLNTTRGRLDELVARVDVIAGDVQGGQGHGGQASDRSIGSGRMLRSDVPFQHCRSRICAKESQLSSNVHSWWLLAGSKQGIGRHPRRESG